MKKIKVILFFLAILQISATAQKVTSVFEQSDFPGVSNINYRYAPLSFKSYNNDLVLAFVKQYVNGAMEKHAPFFFERGQQLVNYLTIYHLNNQLKLNKIISDSCSRDTILNRSLVRFHDHFVKYKLPYKMNRKYPYIFDLPLIEDTLTWKIRDSYLIPFAFDTSLNRYCVFDRGYLYNTKPPTAEGTYTIHSASGTIHDSLNADCSVIWARKPQSGEENQYILKNLTFATYGYKPSEFKTDNFISGKFKFKKSFNLDFQYCRTVDKGLLVYSSENPQTIIGKVYFFTRPMLLTKKGQDPNKNNFNIVYFSKEGELIFERSFTFESEKRAYVSMLYAYGTSKTLSLFTGYSTTEEGFGFLNFAPDSFYKQVTTPIITFKQNTLLAQNEPDIQYFQKREQIFNEFSIRKGISADNLGNMNVYSGHQLLPDGGVIIYGQRMGIKSQMVTTTGSMANATEVRETYYTEFFALHFDASQKLVKQYVSEITNDTKPVKLHAYHANNKLYIVTNMAKTVIMPDGIAELSLESQILRNVKYEYPAKKLHVPKIICIDYMSKNISSYMPTNNFYAFSPDIYHLFTPDGAFYLAGFTQVQNRRTLKIEKVEF